jgi:hypothetical protein
MRSYSSQPKRNSRSAAEWSPARNSTYPPDLGLTRDPALQPDLGEDRAASREEITRLVEPAADTLGFSAPQLAQTGTNRV